MAQLEWSRLAFDLNKLLNAKKNQLFIRTGYADCQESAPKGEEVATLLISYIPKKDGDAGLKQFYELLVELGENQSVAKINNSNFALSFWSVKILTKANPAPDDIRTAPLLEGTRVFANAETWLAVNTKVLQMTIKDVKGSPNTFAAVPNQHGTQGPIYFPNSNPTHTLFRLHFTNTGLYTIILDTDWGIKELPLVVHSISSSDDSVIGQLEKPKINTPVLTQALLLANYEVGVWDTTREQTNILFMLPEEMEHYDRVFTALTQLGYQSSREADWYFLTKKHERSSSIFNILLCNPGHLLDNNVYDGIFTNFLLFILGEGSLRSVPRVIFTQKPALEFKLQQYPEGEELHFNQLNDDQKVIVEFFQSNNKGSITLSNAENSVEEFSQYLRRWLFQNKPIKQKDIYIHIKVDKTHPGAIDHVANLIFKRTEQILQPLPVAKEIHYYGSVVVVISGPPLVWWIIKHLQGKLSADLTLHGLKLLDISLTNAKQLIESMKEDPRNKQFAHQKFSLVCRMRGLVISKNQEKQSMASKMEAPGESDIKAVQLSGFNGKQNKLQKMDAPGEDNIEIVQLSGLPFRKPKATPRVMRSVMVDSKKSTQTEGPTLNDHNETDCTITLANEAFVAKVNIPSIYYKFLIGKKGAMKQKIQKETGATIIIPNADSGLEEVIIHGPNETAVLNAHTRLDIIRNAAHKSLPYSHFLSLPLTGEQLKSKLSTVCSEMIKQFCDTTPAEGVEASLFGSPDTMHVTLLMLKLFSHNEIECAKALMKKISAQVYDILETQPLVLQVGELEVMNDNPSCADVLYLKVKDTNTTDRLTKLYKFLTESFTAEGLNVEQGKEIKLHAILCNSHYRKENEDNSPIRKPFDARPLLAQYGKVSLGQHRIDALHLSERGKYDANRYYHCVDKINLV